MVCQMDCAERCIIDMADHFDCDDSFELFLCGKVFDGVVIKAERAKNVKGVVGDDSKHLRIWWFELRN